MSKMKVEKQVRKHATELVKEKGYVSPVDLLVRTDRLTSKQIEDWRFKKIPYLERVTVGNLSKLNHILKALKTFAGDQHLQPSKSVYKSWGKGPKKYLQFAKKAHPYMEELYSTHYVRKARGWITLVNY